MSKKRFVCALGASAAALFLTGSAEAQWTVTTYNQVVGNPDITSMVIADRYFTGQLPTRFVANSTINQLDLHENGGAGQFTINNPFPGLDANEGAGDTRDFTTRITGTLVVNTPGAYDFFTDSDDGNRFRLDLNRNGIFEDATESILPDGGLQGAGTPERSPLITLSTGSYPFEASFFERGGGGTFDAGYRVNGAGTQFVIGDAAGGLGVAGPLSVRNVGAATGGGGPDITNFSQADALRTGPNEPGFPVTENRATFNIVDTGDLATNGDGDFAGGLGAPGLGVPNANDDDDFLVVGVGRLVVPNGITGVIFRSNTDDGGRLLIDTNNDGDLNDPVDVVINDDVLSGPHNKDSTPVTLGPGTYLIEYSLFERGGGAEGEVSANTGPGGAFRLLGDIANGGLQIAEVPEPSALALLGLGCAALLRRRR